MVLCCAKNKTFEFVDATKMETLPRRVRRAINKNIRCHFVFRAKPDKNGKLLKFKARLVANGNNQQEGINYFSSFAGQKNYVMANLIVPILLELGKAARRENRRDSFATDVTSRQTKATDAAAAAVDWAACRSRC